MNKKLTGIVLTILLVSMNFFAQNEKNGNSLRKNVEILASDSLEGRGFKCSSKVLTIDYLTREFAAAGFSPLNGSYQQKFMNFEYLTATEGANIVGVIEGTDSILKNEYIVIGAHYDHLGWKMDDSIKVIYNGADDNASGVATMIEVGKKLLLNKSQLKRSVLLIAFDGEEAGLIGSKDFVKKQIVDLSKMKVMFSLDMVGMYKANNGLNVAGLYSLENGNTLFNQSLARTNLVMKKSTNSIANRTDTKSFGDKNIPAIHITTGLLSPYHKPEDDSDSLDYEGMEKIAGLLSDLTTTLSNENSLVASTTFKSTKSEDEDVENKSIFKFGYNLGIGPGNHYYKTAFFNSKAVFAFEGGLSSQLLLSKNVVLQAEVNYEYSGGKSPYGTMREHSVVPSFDFLICTNNNKKEHTFFFVDLGGYYRYNFTGKTDATNLAFFDIYNRTELGIKYGFGVQVKNIQINFHDKFGITNIDKIGQYGNVYSYGSYFSIISFF